MSDVHEHFRVIACCAGLWKWNWAGTRSRPVIIPLCMLHTCIHHLWQPLKRIHRTFTKPHTHPCHQCVVCMYGTVGAAVTRQHMQCISAYRHTNAFLNPSTLVPLSSRMTRHFPYYHVVFFIVLHIQHCHLFCCTTTQLYSTSTKHTNKQLAPNLNCLHTGGQWGDCYPTMQNVDDTGRCYSGCHVCTRHRQCRWGCWASNTVRYRCCRTRTRQQTTSHLRCGRLGVDQRGRPIAHQGTVHVHH